jgi:hypothetical protein
MIAVVLITAVIMSIEAQANTPTLTEGEITIKSVKTLSPSSGFAYRAGSGGTNSSKNYKTHPEKLEVIATTSDGKEVKLSTSVFEWFSNAKVEPLINFYHEEGAKISPLEFSKGCYFKITITNNGSKYECKLAIGSVFNYITDGEFVRILVEGDAFTKNSIN